MKKVALLELFDKAINKHHPETKELEFLPKNRYNKTIFPKTGQYDWFSGQLLYCVIRYLKPRRIVEISTSSGYSTLFMAMALKKNRFGRVDTFEIDRKMLSAAKTNFERFRVKKYVITHLGDARREAKRVKGIKEADMFFLDSLHTEGFMRWFVEEFILTASASSLFHMHDILPESARVRKWNGPPWSIFSPYRYRKIAWSFKNLLLGQRAKEGMVKIKIKPPDMSCPLPTYDGNESSEAIFGNKLISEMDQKDYVYCYNIADDYGDLLNSRKYDRLAIGRQDASGRPFEWNESLWAYSEAIKKAYLKITSR